MAVPGRKVGKQISSTLSIGSEEDEQLFCKPCERKGSRCHAFGYCTTCEDHLCTACFNGHRNIKPCRNHILLDKDAMPKSQSVSSTLFHSEELSKPCPKHTRKTIEFYCHDHKALLCNICVTLEHSRSFCNVNYIPDISGQTVNSKEYQYTIKKMDAFLKRCHKVKMEINRAIDNSNSSLSNALKELKKYRQEINKMFDDMEKEVENKAKTHQLENDSRLNASGKKCDDVYQSIKTLYDTIIELNTLKQEENLFVEMKGAQEALQHNDYCMNDISSMTKMAAQYDFEPNTKIASCLENITFLGTIRPKQTSSSALVNQTSQKAQAECSTSLQPSHLGDINVKTSEDKKTCLITGMTLTTADQLVVVDRENYCIKMVDVNSKQIMSQLRLTSMPCDVTSVSTTELAVTMPYEETIQFIRKTSNRLLKKNKVKVDKDCHGISCYQQKLVVTYILPGRLQILDLNGTVLITVRTNQSGNNIFCTPDYVDVNRKAIYVSDYRYSASQVTMLNWQGEVTGSFRRDLAQTEGLALTKKGTVYVCDSEKKNIREISENCTNDKAVVNDLIYPKAISWCEDKRTLYISSSSSGENRSNFIKALKMP